MKNTNIMKKLGRIPFGILAGISGILLFYDTIGIVTLYIIFGRVSAQTAQTATIFDSWYQILMFIFDIIFLIIFGIFLFFFIKNKKDKKEQKNENL